jgi:hypothetical protein
VEKEDKDMIKRTQFYVPYIIIIKKVLDILKEISYISKVGR